MSTAYADVIDAQWSAVSSPRAGTGEIILYPTGRADGGFVQPAPRNPAPPVGTPTQRVTNAFEAETYRTATGARAWRPTTGEDALIREVTSNPMAGLDELSAARSAGGAVATKGSRTIPLMGDIAGGAIDGAMAYGRTGSVGVAVGAGVGSTLGSLGGTALGAALGAPLGPAGVVGGSIVGGLIGGALGAALGEMVGGALVGYNKNGLLSVTGQVAWQPTDGGDFRAYGGVGIVWYDAWNNRTTSAHVLDYSIHGWQHFNQYLYRIRRTLCNGEVRGATNIQSESMAPSSLVVGNGGVCFGGQPLDKTGLTTTTTAPYDPKTNPNTRPATGTPAFRLPQPIVLPRPRLTGGKDVQPTPTPNPTDYPNPTGGPIPTGEPNPITDPTKQPNPNPDGDKPNPNPVEDDPGAGEDCDPCAELKAIRAKLEETFSLAWALPECGEGMEISRNGEREGKGLGGLSQKIDGLYQVLRVLHENTRCGDDGLLVVPEWWQVQVGADRPQLILIYADKNRDGTWGNRRYQFVIPHFDGKLRKTLKQIVPKEIKKGSHQGIYTLADNSKMIMYCQTKTEVARVLKQFERLIIKGLKTGNIKTGEINQETSFLKITVYPYQARYFSRGREALSPDWKDNLY